MRYIFTLGLLLTYSVAFSSNYNNDTTTLPDKIYVFTSKTLYESRETMHLSFFVLSEKAGVYLPTQTSSLVYYEILDGKDEVVYTGKLPVFEGVATSSIPLQPLKGGQYRIRAITSWNTNFTRMEESIKKTFYIQSADFPDIYMQYNVNKDLYFPRDTVRFSFSIRNANNDPVLSVSPEFRILADGSEIAQSKPENVKLNGNVYEVFLVLSDSFRFESGVISAEFDYDRNHYGKVYPLVFNSAIGNVAFLPEGGYLFPGIPCNIAFKCTDKSGLGVDIKGVIVDGNDKPVAHFNSGHRGMGSFVFTPRPGEKYTARILEPHCDKNIPLPEVDTSKEFHLELKNENDLWFAHVYSAKETIGRLELTQDNTEMFGQLHRLRAGKNKLHLKTSNLQPGIVKITLRIAGEAVSERLIFVKPDRNLRVELLHDNNELKAGKMNKLRFRVTDAAGKPVKAILACALVNEKNHNLVNDKQPNLIASFLFTDELKGHIEDPNWYFGDSDSNRLAALDLVMLTHGWRKIHYQGTKPIRREQAFVILYNIDGRPTFSSAISPIQYYRNLHDSRSYMTVFSLASLPQKVSTPWVERENLKNIFIHEDSSLYLRFIRTGMKTTNTPVDERFANGTAKKVVAKAILKDPGTNTNNAEIATGKSETESSNHVIGLAVISIHKRSEVISLTQNSSNVTGYSLLGNGARGVNRLVATNAAILNTTQGLSIRGTRGDGNGTYIDGQRIIGDAASGDLLWASGIPWSSGNFAGWPDNSHLGGSTLHQKTPIVGEHTLNLGNNNQTNGGTIGSAFMSGTGSRSYYYPSSYSYYRTIYHFPTDAHLLPISFKGNTTSYQFYEPVCSINVEPQDRNPASILYCATMLKTNAHGLVEFSFQANMNEAVYRLTVEGFGAGKLLSDTIFLTLTPELVVTWDIPDFITAGDLFYHKIQIKNNTKNPLPIKYIINGESMRTFADTTIEGNGKILLWVPHTQNNSNGFRLMLEHGDVQETFYKNLEIKNRYFENEIELAGSNSSGIYAFTNPGLIQSFILTKTPVGMDDMVSSAAKMMREPYGCFEQVSSSNYPNLLIYHLLKNTGNLSEKQHELRSFIEKGLAALQGYKTKQGGYEWFGNTPPHQALTSYGLIQFHLANQLGFLNTKVVDETKTWLLSQALPNGGFINNAGRYDHFSNIPDAVSDAYITYALARTGSQNLEQHVAKVENDLNAEFNLYRAVLLLNIYIDTKEGDQARELLKKINTYLIRNPKLDKVPIRTITNSTGFSAAVEALSLYGLALSRSDISSFQEIKTLLDGIYAMKSKCGGYQTQANALFLEFAASFTGRQEQMVLPQNNSDKIKVNGKIVEKLNSNMAHQVISIPEDYLVAGNNQINVHASSSNSLYTANIRFLSPHYHYTDTGKYAITNTWISDSVVVGGANMLTVEITNMKAQERGQTVATIFLPDGSQPGPEILNALLKQKAFDYYEIKKNTLTLYFLKFRPNEVRRFNIAVNCLHPGTFYIQEPRIFAFYEDKNMNTGKPDTLKVLLPVQ